MIHKLRLLLTMISLAGLFFVSCNDEDDVTTGNNENGSTNIVEGTLTDADDNTYTTVQIGTQTWMAENLRTTKYNDGTSIPNVTANTDWESLSTPAYCWYENDSLAAIDSNYGALYNYYTVETEKICPEGWHIPTYDEWKTLIFYIESDGYTDSAAIALKTTLGWKDDGNGDNHYGFAAAPAPLRYGVSGDGAFSSITNGGVYWWIENGKNAYLGYAINDLKYKTEDEEKGICIRCLQD